MNAGIKTIQPITNYPAGSYCRLFPPDWRLATISNQIELQSKLLELAKTMKTTGNDTGIPDDDQKGKIPIPAAYTYFGQFIDHDLTHELNPLPLPGEIHLSPIQNYRRSFLNLDILYGDNLSETGIYDEKDSRRFRVGDPINGKQFDVPLQSGKPRTADRRNVENAIIRQIHAMFLLLHNRAVDELSDFEKARRQVRHQFQYLVWKDFLPRVCNDVISQELRKSPQSLIEWRKRFAIPLEFAQAAFRFGHSMVRDKYFLGPPLNHPVKLCQLFGGSDDNCGALTLEKLVEWKRFTQHTADKETAKDIDLIITDELFYVPDFSIETFTVKTSERERSERQHKNLKEGRLPFRTLVRGAASCLCSGQTARDYACPGHGIRPKSQYYGERDPWKYLKQFGLESATPLWYYILLEAQLNEAGVRLGTLGSQIVAGTIVGALWDNCDSYVQHGPPDKCPVHWKIDGEKVQLEDLYSVARFVGLT